MPRIHPVANPAGETRTILDGVKAKIGMVPNLYATLGHAPHVLGAYLEFGAKLGGGKLSAKEREQIALAVGEANACAYCLSAHTAIGKGAGLTDADIAAARHGTPADPRNRAIVSLARSIVSSKGVVPDAELAAARQNGLDDAQIVEVFAVTVQNIFTNYANHLFDTDIDFPKVAPQKAA